MSYSEVKIRVYVLSGLYLFSLADVMLLLYVKTQQREAAGNAILLLTALDATDEYGLLLSLVNVILKGELTGINLTLISLNVLDTYTTSTTDSSRCAGLYCSQTSASCA